MIYVPVASRDQKPVFINGDMYKGSFKRTYEGDYHCTHDEVQAMLRDQNGSQTMDMKVLEDLEIEDLNRESIKAYRTWFENKHEGNAWNSLTDNDFLERIGAASDKTRDRRIHPTCAGLLMFGEEFRIAQEYPGYFLDYQAHMSPDVRWTDRLQSQSPDWPRNANIMKMLHLLGFGEHSGNGVPDIFEAWNTAGLREPVIEEHFGEDGPNKTIVTLPLEKWESLVKSLVKSEKSPEKSPETRLSDEIEKRMEQILKLIREDPTMSRAKMSRTIGITDSQARTAINKLREKGIIHREGSDTAGQWMID